MMSGMMMFLFGLLIAIVIGFAGCGLWLMIYLCIKLTRGGDGELYGEEGDTR